LTIASDGLLITCNYNLYAYDWNNFSYNWYAFVNHYAVPLVANVFYYSKIVSTVMEHERGIREQAHLAKENNALTIFCTGQENGSRLPESQEGR